MNNKNIIMAGLVAMSAIFGAWSFLVSCEMIKKYAAVMNCCTNIKGVEYIVVAAFLGLLPAFFKVVHDETNNRGAMKHS